MAPPSNGGKTGAPSIPPETLQSLPEAALAGMACESAATGDLVGMRALVAAGVSVNVGTPYDQRTPLHLAAASGRLDMVKLLVEDCGATLQRDRFGLLPIHGAVQHGHAEIRRYLQSRKLQECHEEIRGRPRVASMETISADSQGNRAPSLEETMGTVFELIVKEGVFSYTTVHAEVQHFFKGLALHPVYYEHFTPLQIAKHVQCFIAAKRVARATGDMGRMEFAMKSGQASFFLCTIGSPKPTEAQTRTEDKVAKQLSIYLSDQSGASLTFMASEGPAFVGSEERLGIFSAQRCSFDAARLVEGETSLDVLASSRFLKEKTRVAKEQYQVVMEDLVATNRPTIRLVPGSVYPGPYPGGYVLLFGTADTAGRHYFPEVCQSLRFLGYGPKRFYLETFANGALIYSLFFPSAKEEEMQQLGRTIKYAALLKEFPGRSDVVYASVMKSIISHEVGLYLLAAVKFVYAFFPKEQYVREYTQVHEVLQKDPTSQRKLEALYKLCMKELLSTDRIYDLVTRHLDLAVKLFEDFRSIALGNSPPKLNEQLEAAIDAACKEPQDRQILRMFLTFNESILMTNFFKAETPGAFSFRLNPEVVLKDRPAVLYPALPYGIYLVCGRDFMGFHCRFRDVARGGIRLVLSRDKASYERNFATLFDECYNLALTQQYKNKDIPEGGAKGVILPDACWPNTDTKTGTPGMPLSQNQGRLCFTRYLDALLDCMLPEQSGLYSGHMQGRPELLYFGPDENTAGYMDMGAELARDRGYPYWNALTTGKSVRLGGVPHDTYGMTTASVHTYVTELLRELGEDEASITKFQTGGPDGDLGSNEILVSKDKTIGVVDGSGVLYDPAGLDREELTRLAHRRVPVKEFSRSFLSARGFLITVDEVDVRLPDGSQWRSGAELRDNFHLTSFATADLFVPCGGRPNSVSTDSVQHLLSGEGGRPRFRMIVEGANLFFSDGARAALENAGVHLFKDASTNKGGVCSSSLEVFASLALPTQDHSSLMTYDPENTSEPPEFYRAYVNETVATIVENAKQEFRAIWACNQKEGVSKLEATQRLSIKINRMQDSIDENLKAMTEEERNNFVRSVLGHAAPPLMVKQLGIDGIIKHAPWNYVASMVSAWVASRFVYQHGISASEVSFYFFLRSLLEGGASAADKELAAGRKRSAGGEEPPASRPRLE